MTSVSIQHADLRGGETLVVNISGYNIEGGERPNQSLGNMTTNRGINVSHSFHVNSIAVGCALTLASTALIATVVVVTLKVWKRWKARQERLRMLRERHNVQFWRRSSIFSDDDSTVMTVSTFQSSFSHSTLNMYSHIDENEVSNYLVPVPLAIDAVDAVQALNHYENPPPSSFF